MKKVLIICCTLSLFLLPQYQKIHDLLKNTPSRILHIFSSKNEVPPIAVDTPTKPEKVSKNKIQVALLLDTSNSMDGLIDQAKSQLWKVVNELAQANKHGEVPQIQISLYQYGNSGLSMSKGYVEQVTTLTSNLDLISEKLFELKTNGGEEYCGWTISDALNDLEWSTDDSNLKLIFIAGNEPFNQGPKDFNEVCLAAKKNDIIVNTVFCGNYKEGIKTLWKDGADLTGGDYMNIDTDKKVVHIATPYDEIIIRLNRDLNSTYIHYGSGGKALYKNQSIQDTNAGTYGSANERTRASFKAKDSYSNATWDVVDAMEEDEAILETVETETLPTALQGMSKPELKKHITGQKEKRESIKKEILENEKKANAYIRKKRAETGEEETLDKVMLQTVRKQAMEKKFKF